MLGSIALIALLYIYAQMVQHWSWYLFDHMLLREPQNKKNEKSDSNCFPALYEGNKFKTIAGIVVAALIIFIGIIILPIVSCFLVCPSKPGIIVLTTIIGFLCILLLVERLCCRDLYRKYKFISFTLDNKVKTDLGSHGNKGKIQQWQVLELVLKYNPDSGKNIIKEFARSSLAKMLAFNSMVIVIILMVRKVIDPLWCINHTIIGKVFDFNGCEKYCCVVLMFIVLMLMFLREYYLRNGRNNEHLCEAYMAVSSDVSKATKEAQNGCSTSSGTGASGGHGSPVIFM